MARYNFFMSFESSFEKKTTVYAGAETKEKLPDNVVILERPEAKYRIVYEHHNVVLGPEVLGKTDGIAVEFICDRDYSDPKEAEQLAVEYWLAHATRGRGNALDFRLQEAAENSGAPMYFIDVGDTTKNFQNKLKNQGLVDIAESAVGVGIAGKLALDTVKKISENKPTSRRNFLKGMMQGAAAAYLSGGMVEHILQNAGTVKQGQPAESSASRKGARILGDVNESLHPEIRELKVTLRNALFAEKILAIANERRRVLKRKPEITLIVGGGHSGIEKMIDMLPQARARLVGDIIKKNGLDAISKNAAVITELTFDKEKDQWKTSKIFRDPILQREVGL